MSLTATPPLRLVALLGALVLTGVAAVVFLLGRGALASEPAVPTAPTHRAAPATHPAVRPHTGAKPTPHTRPVKHAARAPRIASGFPSRIDHALRYSRVVVVSVAIPGAAVDAVVRREARSAAAATHSGFVALNAVDEHAVSRLVAKTGVLPDPAVVIVRRPGTVAATFSVTDAETIAQAVAEARR